MNKIALLLGITSVMLITTTISVASPLDLLHKTNSSKNYEFTEFIGKSENFNYVANNMEKYIIKAPNGKFYNVKEVSNAIDDGAEDFSEAIENLKPVGDTNIDDFEVVDIT